MANPENKDGTNDAVGQQGGYGDWSQETDSSRFRVTEFFHQGGHVGSIWYDKEQGTTSETGRHPHVGESGRRLQGAETPTEQGSSIIDLFQKPVTSGAINLAKGFPQFVITPEEIEAIRRALKESEAKNKSEKTQ